jgi:hypothetical protein
MKCEFSRAKWFNWTRTSTRSGLTRNTIPTRLQKRQTKTLMRSATEASQPVGGFIVRRLPEQRQRALPFFDLIHQKPPRACGPDHHDKVSAVANRATGGKSIPHLTLHLIDRLQAVVGGFGCNQARVVANAIGLVSDIRAVRMEHSIVRVEEVLRPPEYVYFSDLHGAERRFRSQFGAKFSQLFSQVSAGSVSLAVE